MSTIDWAARSRREAAALWQDLELTIGELDHDAMVSILAIAWLRGSLAGSVDTLELAKQSFAELGDELRATLADAV